MYMLARDPVVPSGLIFFIFRIIMLCYLYLMRLFAMSFQTAELIKPAASRDADVRSSERRIFTVELSHRMTTTTCSDNQGRLAPLKPMKQPSPNFHSPFPTPLRAGLRYCGALST